MERNAWYSRFAKGTSRFCGKPIVFVIPVATIAACIITGPLFGFSDTRQLAINTATTIITFLMVFLIQSTQNRDTEAIHIRLDELICATKGAHNALLDLYDMEGAQLDAFWARYGVLARGARLGTGQGLMDTDSPKA